MNLLCTGTPYDGNALYGIASMFDNNFSTFPDTGGSTGNPAVGVDLGKPHSILFMRFATPRIRDASQRRGAERLECHRL